MAETSQNRASLTVFLADLTHTGHSCTGMPLGIGFVTAHVRKFLPEIKPGVKLETFIFKDPAEFDREFWRRRPRIVAFSNFLWNFRLHYAYAERIRKAFPDTVIIFGGPNYPLVPDEQKEFLEKHPAIDFYLFRNGEAPFTELLSRLIDFDFDVARFKQERINLLNLHYLHEGGMIVGETPLDRSDLNLVPSPYLTGLFDHLLAQKRWLPLLVTTRGCPFKCTFCQEGDAYFNRIRRFDGERSKEELRYIAQRTKNPNLLVTDSNFGMFEQDAEIAREIVRVQEKYRWPQYVWGLCGKNNKAHVLEVAKILQGGVFGSKGVWVSAAIQSTDENVLKAVKRQNIKKDVYLEVVETARQQGADTFSELILALPGDTKAAHLKGLQELMDADIHTVRSHQFLLLMGSELGSKSSIREFDLHGRFRVMPQTVAPYTFKGETFYAPEIDEVCVSSNTLSYEDYLECRLYNLSVEIFYNNGLFKELQRFMKQKGFPMSELVFRAHRKAMASSDQVSRIFQEFVRETGELWATEEEIFEHLRQPGISERYEKGELGNNEQLVYRALAVFRQMPALHELVFSQAREMLREKGLLGEDVEAYLAELKTYSLMQKDSMLETERKTHADFTFDFLELQKRGFEADPFAFRKSRRLEFSHSPQQRELIARYLEIYGDSNFGLGTILSLAANIRDLYRSITPVGSALAC